jgi:PiT family inorganic phosphate transporter
MHSDLILIIVVASALAFDFTNGFHDTTNVVATSISTRALSPRVALALAAAANFAGAFISLKVAAAIANDIVAQSAITPMVIFGGLVGAITWNLATWFFGLPSSSSHALIGGVIGATWAASGSSAVQGDNLVGKVIVPAMVAPVLAFVVAGGAIALVSAASIALGTYSGGWRIIRTTGSRIIKMDPAQGFAAQTSGAATVLAASHVGYPLWTTHVINGGVVGAGAAKRLSAVRWGVARSIAVAWVLTIPAAACVGALAYGATTLFGHGAEGPLVVSLACLAVLTIALGRRFERRPPIGAAEGAS